MKKIAFIFLMITSILLSCEDVLDKKALDIISGDVLWNDQALIDAYLLQCYDRMHFLNDMEFGDYDNKRYISDSWFSATTTTLYC